MASSKKTSVGRRGFLKGAAGAAAVAATPPLAMAQQQTAQRGGRVPVQHKIPLLLIMHNDRGYHQEVMFIARQASIRNRGPERAHIGTKLTDPNIDYAMMAKAYGMYSEGPISNPKDLAPALKRGIERIKKGEPAMIDVVTQPC